MIYKLLNLMKSLRSAVYLDLADINYQFGSDRLKALSLLPRDSLPKRGIIFRFLSFMKNLIKEMFTVITTTERSNNTKSDLIQFFIFTKNQKDCLVPIKNLTKHSYFAGHNVSVELKYPLWISYLISLPFLFIVLWRMFQENKDQREFFKYFFDQYWLMYGYYITACIWLDKTNPNAIILANDHNYPARTILKVAKEKKIPTFYFQHASVTDKFPPLSFDYALLDGVDALEKYDKCGPTAAKVFLVGIAKADIYYKYINNNEQLQSLGICANNLDRIEYVELFCQALRKAFPELKIFLRPHPGEAFRYPQWLRVVSEHNLSFSDARTELSFEFLKKVDAIIVGDSNILLEAALMNVFPIYYDFNRLKLDWYGFIENGLTEYMSEPAQVCQRIEQLLQHKPYIRDRAKRYCHTIGTIYDGRSAELAANVITAIVNRDLSFMKRWKKIPGTRIEAYEPLPTE